MSEEAIKTPKKNRNTKWAKIKEKIKAKKAERASPYERKGVYSLDAIFDNIDKSQFDYDGDIINVQSARYRLFAKSVVCVKCGIAGSFFAKERHAPSKGRYHFNLYAVREDGKEILMTKDHIVPRAKGGKDTDSNYQTMCSPCNQKKGSDHE